MLSTVAMVEQQQTTPMTSTTEHLRASDSQTLNVALLDRNTRKALLLAMLVSNSLRSHDFTLSPVANYKAKSKQPH